jgi:hypothetical protein
LPGGRRTLTDADGDTYTLRLTGPGQVGVIAAADGSIGRIALSPAVDPLRTRLSVTVRKGPFGDGLADIGAVTGPGLRALTAPKSDLVGAGVSLDGYLGSLTVRDIKNGADVLAGGAPAQRTVILAADVGDGTTIQVGSGISTLRAARFGDGRITSPRIGTLSVTGSARRVIPADFAADVRLTGAGVVPGARALGALKVGGTVRGSAIEVAGNAGSVRADAFEDSSLLLGLDGTMMPGFKLGSFAATGFPGWVGRTFADSTVTADRIGTVLIKSVGTTRPDEPFGVTAGVSLGRLKVATPAFLYDATKPSPQGLNLDADADLEFVVRVG